jgi:acyl carrier protein
MHTEQIRTILGKHARLAADAATLTEDTDLYGAGLTSLTTVNLMLALEDEFNLEFPESMLGRKTFQSIRSLNEAVTELKQNAPC